MSTTRTAFEEDLKSLRLQLLEMGSAADGMLERAVRALVNQDVNLAARVISDDDLVDEMDVAIETECLRLLAVQQPVARDLRLVGSALKVISDIERVADHCVDIAKVARQLSDTVFYKPLVDVPRLATLVRQMLHTALTAFVNYDSSAIDAVIRGDDDVDALYHQLRDELHEAMRSSPTLVIQASHLLFVSHYLERIADHAVNIAERLSFAETGELPRLSPRHGATS